MNLVCLCAKSAPVTSCENAMLGAGHSPDPASCIASYSGNDVPGTKHMGKWDGCRPIGTDIVCTPARLQMYNTKRTELSYYILRNIKQVPTIPFAQPSAVLLSSALWYSVRFFFTSSPSFLAINPITFHASRGATRSYASRINRCTSDLVVCGYRQCTISHVPTTSPAVRRCVRAMIKEFV